MLVEFSLYIFYHGWKKSFKLMVLIFLENEISLDILLMSPFPAKFLPQDLIITHLKQREITHSSQEAHSLKSVCRKMWRKV